MRVALDASMLELPPSGTATYIRSLVAGLRAIDPELDLHLLTPEWETTAPAGVAGRVLGDRRVRRFVWDAVGSGRAARAVRPDLLHVPRFAAPVCAGCPVVVTIHDVIPFVLPAYRASRAMRLHLALMARTTRRARLVLTPSRAAAADITRVLGIPAERIRVTPEAADPSFRPGGDPGAVRAVRARYGIGGRYIFNVGGLDVRKNLAVLIEAFSLALPRLADPVDLVIAGAAHSGNPGVFPPLAPVVERLGMVGKVHLVGRVSEEEKLALYRGAALYVTPSLYEGFGLTALEAMACGVPVIAANRTSLPEVVGDGGVLVEPDAESLADAIVRVLGDAALASDLRTRGMARAEMFSWEETARLTRAAYDEAVRDEGGRGGDGEGEGRRDRETGRRVGRSVEGVRVAVKRVLEARDALRLLAPGPLALVTTMYRDQPNVMTAGWLLPLSFDPVLIGVAIHPGRLTHEFATKSEVFALNIPNVDLTGAVHACGMTSGREGDKWAATGLTPVEALEIEAPLVTECVAHIECGLFDRMMWGDHDLFVGRVLRVQADEEAFSGFWDIESDAGRLLHHLGADRYAGLARPYRVKGEDEE